MFLKKSQKTQNNVAKFIKKLKVSFIISIQVDLNGDGLCPCGERIPDTLWCVHQIPGDSTWLNVIV